MTNFNKIDHKRNWFTLKEELIKEYFGHTNIVDTMTSSDDTQEFKGMAQQVKFTLKRMEQLDGSNDFRNLLYDLGDIK